MTLALSAADRAALIARHKAAIDGSLKTKLTTIAVVGGLVGLFLYGLTTLETSLWKIIAGFSKRTNINSQVCYKIGKGLPNHAYGVTSHHI